MDTIFLRGPTRGIAAGLIVAACALGGCGGRGDAAGGANAVSGGAPYGRQRAPRHLSGPRARGIPHGGPIDDLALSFDGKVALTRDAAGGVRFWARLDGTAQPIPAPLRGPTAMSLATRGKQYTAAMVDSAGGTHFYSIAADGSFSETATLPPARAIRQIIVLPGGETALGLRDDRSLELLSVDTGAAIARTTKRKFKPGGLRVAADGKSAIAIEVTTGATADETQLAVYRIRVDLKAKRPSIKIDAAPAFTTKANVLVGPQQATLSPDGSRFALLQVDTQTGTLRVLAAELATGKDATFDLGITQVEQISIGFVGNSLLSVNTQPNGRSWHVDVDTGKLRPQAAPATHLATAAPAHGYARGTHVVGLGGWLYVRSGRKVRYLGFESFEPAGAAVSPDKKWVAWVTGRGSIYVESLGDEGAPVSRIDGDAINPMWRLVFIGNDHVLAADQVGGLSLIHWPTGKVRARADSGGPITSLELHPSRPLVAVTRQSGQTWIYSVTVEKGFSGPYVLDDRSFRSGFLESKDHVVWTLDASNQRRLYTWAEIKNGVTREEVAKRAEPAYPATPMSVDARGRTYVYQQEGGGAVITITTPGEKPRKLHLSSPSLYVVSPSPDASLVALLVDTGLLSVYDAATGRRLWTYSLLQGTMVLSWSLDGQVIASASMSGAAVLSARTGKPLRVTCGPWFEVRDTAPPLTFSGQIASICSR